MMPTNVNKKCFYLIIMVRDIKVCSTAFNFVHQKLNKSVAVNNIKQTKYTLKAS